MNTVLVLVEHIDGNPKRASLEALGAARSISEAVVAVLAGPGADRASAKLAGATKALALSGDPASPDAFAAAIAAAAKAEGAKVFLASATSTGRDLAPRVAALLGSPLASDCIGLERAGDAVVVVRPWLAGKLIA